MNHLTIENNKVVKCDKDAVSVTIPEGVTSIGDEAFYECSSLQEINVNLSNLNYTSIDGILYNKDITELICCPAAKDSIIIPNSVTSI